MVALGFGESRVTWKRCYRFTACFLFQRDVNYTIPLYFTIHSKICRNVVVDDDFYRHTVVNHTRQGKKEVFHRKYSSITAFLCCM